MNRLALLRVLAGVVAMFGGGETVLRHVHSAILAVLRPAEAAARRLIAIEAHGMAIPVVATRPAPCAPIPAGKGEGRIPSFALFDPRRRVGAIVPRAPGFPNVRFFDGLDAPVPQRRAASPDDPVTSARLRRRLDALLFALGNIPRQARRLVRRYAKQARPLRPLRPGRPPGHVERGEREVDILLADCHELALIALGQPVKA